jgi:hypothetical protein
MTWWRKIIKAVESSPLYQNDTNFIMYVKRVIIYIHDFICNLFYIILLLFTLNDLLFILVIYKQNNDSLNINNEVPISFLHNIFQFKIKIFIIW